MAWLAAAQHVAFGTLTRLAAEKRTHHSPAVVTPLAVSAGGGMFPQHDDKLPCGADRNCRLWLRVELSSTLLECRTARVRGSCGSADQMACLLRPPDRGVL